MASPAPAPADRVSCRDLLNVVDSVIAGCPWTKIKTASQLCTYAKSEVVEIEDELAQSQTDVDGLVGECGDLIFDALLLARIVERDFPGAKLEDMLAGIVEKVKRRCPHVFSGEACRTPEEAAAIWQREKAKEKGRVEEASKSALKKRTRVDAVSKQSKKQKL